MLVNQLPCMFPSNAWAFIFCHFWQIAEHTHIFSLPLPHKLWLHMGKHRLPQGCSKRRPTPRTHSRDSRTGSRHMVSGARLGVCKHHRSEWHRKAHRGPLGKAGSPGGLHSHCDRFWWALWALVAASLERGDEWVAWCVHPLALILFRFSPNS